jgi:heptosyltransferase II
MRILIELPTWLGDAVMTSPAINNLISHFEGVELTIIGSQVSLEVIENHPRIVNSRLLNKSLLSQFFLAREIGEFDYFFSFRNSTRSKILKFFIRSKNKFHFESSKYHDTHQVEKYNSFIDASLGVKTEPGKLKIYLDNSYHKKQSPLLLLGINPGASYGHAKRWYPEKFAEVSLELSSKYDIIILGGDKEVEIAHDIERLLIKNKVLNFKNLAGKTSVSDLKNIISSFDLFITGDSGPMHIAASFNVPTVSIFGPTNSTETSQWMNDNGIVVKKNLSCQPCLKRTCPLKHHKCMKEITGNEVFEAVKLVT